jgi:hypothetical protein
MSRPTSLSAFLVLLRAVVALPANKQDAPGKMVFLLAPVVIPEVGKQSVTPCTIPEAIRALAADPAIADLDGGLAALATLRATLVEGA